MENPNIENQENSAFQNDSDIYNKRINSIPAEAPGIGIDLDSTVYNNIIELGDASKIDISTIESFTSITQNRNQVYDLIDAMGEDSIIASALETYAEDSTEYNDTGRIVWVESDDASAGKMVEFLLDTLNVDKNIYKWAYSLIKYGDLYLKLYRRSEYESDILFDKDRKHLQEDVKLKAYDKNDKYVHYLEMVPNPAEMFELTKFGKSYAYIQAPSAVQKQSVTELNYTNYKYNFRKTDVNVYEATEFVHACLEDNASRTPEEVSLFLDEANSDNTSNTSATYTVRRGQSILYNIYKIWRELMLLENSVLLNRLTKSSIVRLINVEVGDMPKSQVGPHLMKIKQMIEQKAAINTDVSLREYTNPGPIENNVYVPTHGGIGTITTTQVGGDVDVKSLIDLDYFQNKLFGALKIPKQFLGCLRGNTPILLLNGSKITVEEMFNNKDKYIGKGIMACDKDGSLVPTTISNIMLTKPSTGFYRIHLDNGEYVDVTNDHRMMLRDGSYILAEDLSIGDSLMPYYDYIKDGRRYVLDNNSGKFKKQYRVVSESIYDIPKNYQVHHKDCIKINDDFDNLVPLSLEEHYAEHSDMLHEKARECNIERKSKGEHTAQYGAKVINNGIRELWLKGDDDLPLGYSYGRLPFTEEHKNKISLALSNKPKTYDAYSNFGKDYIEKTIHTKQIRKEMGLYDEQYKSKSEELKQRAIDKTGLFSDESKRKRMSRFPENRIKKEHYVRCLCCGNIENIKCNDDWYNDYLDEKLFWFCSKECSKINGKGKLARSYQLFLSANCDADEYECLRYNTTSRPDTFFKYETLNNILPYIENYVPNCNHQVVDIEYIDVEEPAYDISVEADCHTFALPCGIFVHNCTDDATGFNGGTALSLTSSRYAKTIKRIQNTLVQAITDAINLMLIDKGLDSYVNKFQIHMLPPTTQEEKDRQENLSSEVQLAGDIVTILGDIDNPATRLKITKLLLSSIVTDTEIINIIQDEIDMLETSEEYADEMPEDEESFDDNEPLDIGGSAPRASANDDIMNDIESSEETDTDADMTEPSEEAVLPSPSDLNIDFTDSDNEF